MTKDPRLPLRLGLGLMFLYSGQDLIRHPSAWYWALPFWLKQMISAAIPLETYIRIQGGIEIAMAVVLLAWFVSPKIVKWCAVLSSAEFAAILLLAFLPWSEANFLITFRDIGILGASVALAMLTQDEPGL